MERLDKEIHKTEAEYLKESPPEGTDLEGDNKFRGKVVEMNYQGDFTETRISLNQVDRLITVHLSNEPGQNARFSLGGGVLLCWSRHSSNILIG